eukprot:TRINITY_DN8348_c0_g1_i15.p2 TRINITY_DN8348_c0_g1~~TRINITY_DN8348_c0_g1_i15.p2  ORF type:complete len:105 (-),score=25.51 TRINITY_DN8348_c0_g1_i15:103-417(-)
MNITENDKVFIKGLTYGDLTIKDASEFKYEQKGWEGKVVDKFENARPAAKRGKEKIIAIVVLVCSLLFLCYFIYSWLSCYLKKPRVTEEREQRGYAMQSIGSNL